MNQSYLMTLRECDLSKHYEIIKERESKDSLLGSLFYLAEDPMFDVFVKHKPSSPEQEVINVVNLNEYIEDKTIGYTYTNTIEKFYVCMLRVSQFSEPKPQYCMSCGNTCCTCDPSPDSIAEEDIAFMTKKVDEIEALDRACKDEPFYCNIKATSPDEPSFCTTQCTDCYNYEMDRADANKRKSSSVLGANTLLTQYIHGRYLDYWDVIPASGINKRVINNLVETNGCYIYIKWNDGPAVAYRVTMYTKEMLKEYYRDIQCIYVLPVKYDRSPSRPASPIWLAKERTQMIINISLTISIVYFLLAGFFVNSEWQILISLGSIILWLVYNVWVSDYINRDRGLSNEAYSERYGK